MATMDEYEQPPRKTSRCFYAVQFCFRLLATATTLVAAWMIFTAKETTVVFGITVDARYSYSEAFKFFAYANVAACGFSVLFLFITVIVNPRSYFCIFLHDLVMSTLLMAGCAAASAIGWVGKYGNSHTGWMAICDHFAKYCERVTFSVMLSYIAVIDYLILTIISASRSRKH